MSGGPSRGWPGGSTRKWRAIRKKRLELDGYQCQIRGEKCTGKATQVHHVYGRAVSGDDDINALVSACANCNLGIGDPNRIRKSRNQSTKKMKVDPDSELFRWGTEYL